MNRSHFSLFGSDTMLDVSPWGDIGAPGNQMAAAAPVLKHIDFFKSPSFGLTPARQFFLKGQ